MEIFWIFFGVHTFNAVCMIEKVTKKKKERQHNLTKISGEKRGELKKAKETALSMAEEGMDVKMIARLVKVSEKDVQKWIDETLCVTK